MIGNRQSKPVSDDRPPPAPKLPDSWKLEIVSPEPTPLKWWEKAITFVAFASLIPMAVALAFEAARQIAEGR